MLEGTDEEFEIARELLKKENITLGKKTLNPLREDKCETVKYINGELMKHKGRIRSYKVSMNINIPDIARTVTYTYDSGE